LEDPAGRKGKWFTMVKSTNISARPYGLPGTGHGFDDYDDDDDDGDDEEEDDDDDDDDDHDDDDCGMVNCYMEVYGDGQFYSYVNPKCTLIAVSFSCKPQCHAQLRQHYFISFL
jgi:hypothetical protein